MFEAIILAGGLGTRLRSMVGNMPKPMAPVADRPFLAWQLGYLAKCGVRRAVLSVGYLAEHIREYFGNAYGGIEIVYCEESSPLGTGGAIRESLCHVRATRAIVFNGDTLVEFELEALRERANAVPGAIGVVVKKVRDAGRYGAIEFDPATGLISRFAEKFDQGEAFINAGVYDVSRELFDHVELQSPFSFEMEVLQAGLCGRPFVALEAGDFFIDIGVPEDYKASQIKVPPFVRGA